MIAVELAYWQQTILRVLGLLAAVLLALSLTGCDILDKKKTPLPGERTPVHTHRWPASHYIVSWGHFVRRDAEGNVLVDTRSAATRVKPEAMWGDALPPHSLENVGDTLIHVISTEVKG